MTGVLTAAALTLAATTAAVIALAATAAQHAMRTAIAEPDLHWTDLDELQRAALQDH